MNIEGIDPELVRRILDAKEEFFKEQERQSPEYQFRQRLLQAPDSEVKWRMLAALGKYRYTAQHPQTNPSRQRRSKERPSPHNSERFNVYALFEVDSPETIRYVGITGGSILTRFRGHLHSAKHNRIYPVNHWIYRLLQQGKRPEVKLLQAVNTRSECEAAETKWIATLLSTGHPLLNVAKVNLNQLVVVGPPIAHGNITNSAW